MTTLGLCFIGPVNTVWFRFLHRIGVSPIKSLIADQIVIGPVICAGFCFLHPLLSGKSKDEAVDHLFAKFWSVILTGWCLWTPCQTVNFIFVPYQFRLLYTQVVSLIWNTILSYMANTKK